MRTNIKMELAPIEEDGIHLFISGRINGKKARFLIDTGASRSVLDKDRLARFFKGGEVALEKTEKLSTGLGTNTMESNTITLELLSIGRLIIRKYHIVALDLTHVNQSYQHIGLKKIDGVIGGDLLLSLRAIIDYREKVLQIG